jgi:hypothetical protein
MAKHDAVYIVLLGNRVGERIGIVKYNEKGYYLTNIDETISTPAQVKEKVEWLNGRLEMPADVIDSMKYASMFGWDKPVADAAHAYFREPEATSTKEIAEALTPKPTTIDLTPAGCATPEGNARVAKALDEWNSSAHSVANLAQNLLSGKDNGREDDADWTELREAITVRNTKQESFLRAVAGAPEAK